MFFSSTSSLGFLNFLFSASECLTKKSSIFTLVSAEKSKKETKLCIMRDQEPSPLRFPGFQSPFLSPPSVLLVVGGRGVFQKCFLEGSDDLHLESNLLYVL